MSYICVMDTNIQKIKLDLIQWLASLDDSSLIQKILELRSKEAKNYQGVMSETEKESVERGLSDAENGKLKPHKEAFKIYEKWL